MAYRYFCDWSMSALLELKSTTSENVFSTRTKGQLININLKFYLSMALSGSMSRKNSSSFSTAMTGACRAATRNWRAGEWPSRNTAYRDDKAHLLVRRSLWEIQMRSFTLYEGNKIFKGYKVSKVLSELVGSFSFQNNYFFLYN